MNAIDLLVCLYIAVPVTAVLWASPPVTSVRAIDEEEA